jgi:hypothetical protein
VIAFLLPFLPLDGGSVFSFGWPLRMLASYILGWWTTAAVVAVGIVFLRRGLVGVAGGVFMAVDLTIAITVTRQLLDTAPHFGRWQTDLFLTLEIVEGLLLGLAAVRAIRAQGT